MNININSGKTGPLVSPNFSKASPAPQQNDNHDVSSDNYTPGRGALSYKHAQTAFNKEQEVRPEKVAQAREELANWQSPSDEIIDSIFAGI